MYYRALKLIRQYHRLSQTELAEGLSYSKSFISELEKEGGKRPSIDVLERYSNFFKIPMSSLLIFAENAQSAASGSTIKAKIADKALSMLEWLEATGR